MRKRTTLAEILREEFINAGGYSPSFLAMRMDVPVEEMNGVLAGAYPTRTFIKKLAEVFKTTEEFWNNMLKGGEE